MNKLEKQRRRWVVFDKRLSEIEHKGNAENLNWFFSDEYTNELDKKHAFEEQFLDKFFEKYRYRKTRIIYAPMNTSQISFIYIVKESGKWFLIELVDCRNDLNDNGSRTTIFNKFVEITPEYAKELISAEQTLSKLSLLQN